MPYAQFTLAQLLTLFYQQVGGNQAFFRPDEATRILQEAFRVFNVLTGFWRGRISMGTTVAGQVYYTTPAGMSYLLRAELNGTPLASSSLWDLDYGRPGWENETGTPQAFAPAGVNLFALWPASASGGESLTVDGVVAAPVLTNVGFVDLGQDELETILDYAEHIAQFKEGGQEFQASQLNLQEFLKEAGGRNAMLKQSAKFRKWMGLTDRAKRPMRTSNEQVGAR